MGVSFANLISADCAFAEVGDESPSGDLMLEEKKHIVNAVPSRAEEFRRGRICARRALHDFGVEPAAIPVGDQRAPIWPEGFSGSITHCEGFTAAVVGRRSHYSALGIDAEPNERLDAGVLNEVLTETEQQWVEANQHAALCLDKLVFCAKEAIYKAWWPVHRSWLGFGDAELSIDLTTRSFTAKLAASEWLPSGSFNFDNSHILTLVEY